jgi:glycosyltransferase involved in cell wall biosynthesis
MLLSIVMPCHNRLHLLKDAIETVRLQSVTNWQLVVFDNCSSDPIREHVASLQDPRIKFERSEEFLPVTESWNRAFALSDGDYYVLLGDDDGLLPGAIQRLVEIVDAFGSPDFVYADIFQFWHQGVAPWRPSPHVVDVRHGFFFEDQQKPFKLSTEQMKRAVIGSLDLRINFSFNSQACFYSREFVNLLLDDGGFFKSPFPDYYIANAAMALSRSTVIVPEPLAFAGVSRSSYGFALYNNDQAKGDKLLNIKYERDAIYDQVKHRLLPGPTYNTNFIIAMEHVARRVGQVITHPAAFERYRKMQIIAVLRDLAAGRTSPDIWRDLRRRLTVSERIWAATLQILLAAARRDARIGKRLMARLDAFSDLSGFPPKPRYSGDLDCHSAVDVYRAFQAGSLV